MKIFALCLLLWAGLTIGYSKAAEVVTKEDAIQAIRDYRAASKLIAGIHMELMRIDLGEKLEIPKARIEDYKRARKLLEQSVARNPYFPDAYLLLANSYWEIENDLARTVEFYTKALEVDPEYDDIISARAAVHLQLNQVEAAEKDLERLVALGSEHADPIREEIARVKNADADK